MTHIAFAWEPGAGKSVKILPAIIVTNERRCLPLLWRLNHSKRGVLGGWEAPRGSEICRLDCIKKKKTTLRLCCITAYLCLGGCVWGGNGASGLHPLHSGSTMTKRPRRLLKTADPVLVSGSHPWGSLPVGDWRCERASRPRLSSSLQRRLCHLFWGFQSSRRLPDCGDTGFFFFQPLFAACPTDGFDLITE